MTDVAVVSGTKGTSLDHDEPPPLPECVQAACHDVNSALATILLCIDFLAERAGSVDMPAVTDAHLAIRRIADDMGELRERADCSQLASSGVFKCVATEEGAPRQRR